MNESGTAPTKASMVSNLESPVNPLTGAVSFDIPVYTIKAGNYSLPITLHYETSGFKVATIASNIGMGWELNAGGCITKTVKGLQDTSNSIGYCSNGNTADSIHEYVVGLTHVNSLDDLQTPWDTSLFATLLNITDHLFDAEPDIYSFNFAGYSGNFIYDMDNNIHLIPEQNFNIERTNYGFIITVDNGDKYYFGEEGNNSSIEITDYFYDCPLFWDILDFERNHGIDFKNFRMRHLFRFDDREEGVCPTFFLTKIEPADSQQQIHFEYEADDVRTYLGTDETYLFGKHSQEYNDPTLLLGHDWVVHRINRYKFSHTPRLRRITWQNGEVDFIPSNDYRKDLDYYAFPDPIGTNIFGGHTISKITISSMDNNSSVSESYDIDLHSSYFTDLRNMETPNKDGYGYPFEYRPYYRRLRLDSITFNDLNENSIYGYNFDYNRLNNLYCFSRNTSQVDFWGYFKPRGTEWSDIFIERYAIKPKLYYYENGKENPLYNSAYSSWERSGETPTYILEGNSDMTPDLEGCKEFTLKTVHLPTGGSVRFDYELNDFHFDNQDISGPGVRVKSVSYGYYNNHGSTYHELYKTAYSYTKNGHSSGRVANIPDIGQQNMEPQYQGFTAGVSGIDRRNLLTARQFSTVTDMRGMSESTVQYEKVTETRCNNDTNMGKTVYHHQMNMMAEDSVLMIGDEPFVKKTKCKWTRVHHHPDYPGLDPPFYNIQHIDASPMFTHPITSWFNGYLTKKECFDNNDNLVEKTDYRYSLKPSNDSIFYIQSKYLCKYSTSWILFDDHQNPQYDFPIYQYDILWGVNYYKTGVRQLDTIIHTYYSDDNGTLANVTTQTFIYNDINYVSEERTENSDGSIIQQHYTYPFDYASWHPNFVFRDMMDRNMKNCLVEQYTSVDNKVTQGLLCQYHSIGGDHGFIKPEKMFKLRTDSPLTDFQPSTQNPSHDSHYKLTNEMTFDPTNGNLVELWDESEGTTAYVWGYHNSLLLAKVQNATAAEVEYALSCTMEALQEKTDSDELIGLFQDLREDLPQAMITSYTYDLFQKLVSITEPSGKTSRFEYDPALRLRLTRDVENNILQEFEYHYYNH